jgi:hypothetical protein
VPSGTTTTQSPRSRIAHRLPVAGPAIDGEGAEGVQDPGLPAVFEQLALGHVVDGPAYERTDDEGVEEAAVVGGQQQRPAAGEMLAADALEAEVDEKERNEERADGPVDDWVYPLLERALVKRLELDAGRGGMFALARWKVIDNACPLIVHAPDTPSESPSLQPSTQLRWPRGELRRIL